MTFWDIDNLVSSKIDKIALAKSICQSSAAELLDTYKILCDFTDKLINYSNLPVIVFTLFEFKYAYGFEILNRYLYSHDFSMLDLPDECVEGDYDTLRNVKM